MATVIVINKVGVIIEQGASAADFKVGCAYTVFDTVAKTSFETSFFADVTAAMTEAQTEVAIRNAAVESAQYYGFPNASNAGVLMPHLRRG